MLNIAMTNINTNPIHFRGYKGNIQVVDNGVKKTCDNYTEFFRNYPTLDFTTNYIVQNFPQGTEISEFGCSTGQTMRSRLILLDEHNKDQKYKATGYDFPPIIEKIKIGLYKLEKYNKNEQILFPTKTLYDFQKSVYDSHVPMIKQKFFEYFSEYNPSEKPKIKIALTHTTAQKLKEEKLLEEQRLAEYKNLHKSNYELFVTPNEQKFNGIADFQVGNIRDIDQIIQQGKSGVVCFQNALYHIMDSRTLDGYEHVKVDEAKDIFKKVNKVLPENGLFVIGSLFFDHLYNCDEEEKTHLIYQDNKQIRVFDSSPVHKALREAGFEPAFFEKTEGMPIRKYNAIHLPSVWKKVSHLK